MKNHYIPAFYTKRWAAEDRRLVRFMWQSSRLIDRRKYPSQIGYAKDIYTLPGIEDSTKNMLENDFFRVIDQQASDVLEKLERDGAGCLDEESRLSWIVFLISLRQRNPEKLLDIGRQAAEIFQNDIETYRQQFELRREEGKNQSFDEFIDGIRKGGWFERTNKLLVRGAILLPQTTQALLSFVWEIFVFNPPEYELLTSDRPVIMTNGLAMLRRMSSYQ